MGVHQLSMMSCSLWRVRHLILREYYWDLSLIARHPGRTWFFRWLPHIMLQLHHETSPFIEAFTESPSSHYYQRFNVYYWLVMLKFWDGQYRTVELVQLGPASRLGYCTREAKQETGDTTKTLTACILYIKQMGCSRLYLFVFFHFFYSLAGGSHMCFHFLFYFRGCRLINESEINFGTGNWLLHYAIFDFTYQPFNSPQKEYYPLPPFLPGNFRVLVSVFSLEPLDVEAY